MSSTPGPPQRRARRPRPPAARRVRLPSTVRRPLGVAGGLVVLGVVGALCFVRAPDAADARRSPPPPPAPTRTAACARADGAGFPVGVRVHGGPDAYRGGDAFRYWSIDLVNRARTACRNLHPVVVLTDSGRVLRPVQVRLDFHDGARWRPVRMEHTDRDENVGAFDGDALASAGTSGTPRFPGFTLRPGAHVTVRVRLALAADAAPDDVVAQVAVVQRHGDDGDWVGESADYAFTVVADG